MDAEPHPRTSWAAALVLILLIAGGTLLLRSSLSQHPQAKDERGDLDEPREPQLSFDDALRALGDPQTRSMERAAATEIVIRYGPDAVPPLTAMLDSESAEVRLSAVVLLQRIGPEAAEAGPRLLALCADPEPRVREATLGALLQVETNHRSLLDPIRRALAEGPALVSERAVDALAELKPPAIEDLHALASDSARPQLGLRALGQLSELAGSDPQLLRRLLREGFHVWRVEQLKEPLEQLVRKETDDEVHLAALLVLVGPGSSLPYPTSFPHPAGDDLHFGDVTAGVVRHRDAPRCVELIDYLGQFGARSDPALTALLESQEHRTRCRAALYLADRPGHSQSLLPFLRTQLKTSAPGTEDAVWALAKLGTAGHTARTEILDLAKGPPSRASEAAQQLLDRWQADSHTRSEQ